MKELTLLYDGECPICRQYSLYLELKKKYDIRIVNARSVPELIKQLYDKGFDINRGMILIDGDKIYHGHEVLIQMRLLTKQEGFFDKLNSYFLSFPLFVKFIYPFIKAFRKVLLFFLGVKNINIPK